MSNITATMFRSSFKDLNFKSTSENNLASLSDEIPLNDTERNQEKLETMKIRKNALEETLEKKLNELRSLCIREGELTGVLPRDFPLRENEELPMIRRRVKTEFTISDKLLMEPKTDEEEKLNKLELDFELQCKIVKATSKLCNEMNLKKSIKKQRKQVFQQAVAKLKDIEKNLQLTKKSIEEAARRSRFKRDGHFLGPQDEDGGLAASHRKATRSSSYSLNEERFSGDDDDDEDSRGKPQTFDAFPKDLTLITMSSAPSTPVRFRNKKFIIVNENPVEHTIVSHRRANNNSPEYDTISSAASSLGSASNVFAPNSYAAAPTTTAGKRPPGKEFNNYEELFENSPEETEEAKQLCGLPTRRAAAIAPNLSQDDSNLIGKKSSNRLPLPLDQQITNERLRSLTRHNSLDKVRPQEDRGLENSAEGVHLRTNCNRISSTNLLSPNHSNLPAAGSYFNFGNLIAPASSNLVKNKPPQNNINMAQRPLPSPPTERHRKTGNKPANPPPPANKPPPLNLNKPTDHCLLNNKSGSYQGGGSLIKNHPIKSPSTASMLLQSPLDFEKATSLYLNKQRSINNLAAHLLNAGANQPPVDQARSESGQRVNELNLMKPVRSSVVRTPALTINTCSSDLQLQQQQRSPVPLLPPRTPVTSKPNLTNASVLNTASNSNLNHLPNSSYPTVGYAKSMMISSNPNLNYASSSPSGLMSRPPPQPNHTAGYGGSRSHSRKPAKGWTETCIDSFLLPNNASNSVPNSAAAQPPYRANNFYPSHQLASLSLANETHSPSNNPTNDKFVAFSMYNQLREKESQFTSNRPGAGNLPSRSNNSAFGHPPPPPPPPPPPTKESSQSSLSSSSMLQSSNSSSILSNASSSASLHTATQVFQPFIEETKPYQLSDFYRYSTKYKNSQKNLQQKKEREINVQETLPESQLLDRLDTTLTLTKNDSTDLNSTAVAASALMEESFFAKNQVASEFTNELKDWLKEKYDKTATLV